MEQKNEKITTNSEINPESKSTDSDNKNLNKNIIVDFNL